MLKIWESHVSSFEIQCKNVIRSWNQFACNIRNHLCLCKVVFLIFLQSPILFWGLQEEKLTYTCIVGWLMSKYALLILRGLKGVIHYQNGYIINHLKFWDNGSVCHYHVAQWCLKCTFQISYYLVFYLVQ